MPKVAYPPGLITDEECIRKGLAYQKSKLADVGPAVVIYYILLFCFRTL